MKKDVNKTSEILTEQQKREFHLFLKQKAREIKNELHNMIKAKPKLPDPEESEDANSVRSSKSLTSAQ